MYPTVDIIVSVFDISRRVPADVIVPPRGIVVNNEARGRRRSRGEGERKICLEGGRANRSPPAKTILLRRWRRSTKLQNIDGRRDGLSIVSHHPPRAGDACVTVE